MKTKYLDVCIRNVLQAFYTLIYSTELKCNAHIGAEVCVECHIHLNYGSKNNYQISKEQFIFTDATHYKESIW